MRSRLSLLARLVLAGLYGGLVSACAGHPATGVLPAAAPASLRATTLSPGSYIKHIVVIVQENRSFENMFAGWPGADAPLYGYLHTGQRVKLHQMTYAQDCYDIRGFSSCDLGHLWQQGISSWDNGKMDGFDRIGLGTLGTGPRAGTYPYAYLDANEIAPYRAMAKQYVLADQMFPTEFGTSFTAHQDLIAGTTQIDPSHSLVNIPMPGPPWGCEAPSDETTSLVDTNRIITSNGPFPCFDQYQTIADPLDAAHVSWKYYAPSIGVFAGSVWSAFSAIKNVYYGPDWKKNVITPETIALTDPAKGKLPSVSWIIPDLQWSDHPITTSNLGPDWVGDLVDAIGKSKYWNSTAIVVLWDDWGGWYDNAPPKQLDYVGLGIRVPCIIISPYARKGYVSHTQYEYGSILKFIEQTFNLRSLGTTDVRAASLIDSFDFAQKPRAFVPIATRHPASFFLHQPPSLSPPDND